MAVGWLTIEYRAQRYQPGCQIPEAELTEGSGGFIVQNMDLNLTPRFSKTPCPALAVPHVPKSTASHVQALQSGTCVRAGGGEDGDLTALYTDSQRVLFSVHHSGVIAPPTPSLLHRCRVASCGLCSLGS